MKSDWIVGVISDLRVFAELNGMDQLAVKLGEAVDAATDELAAGGDPIADEDTRSHAARPERLHREAESQRFDGRVIEWRPRARRRA